jgi:hypothetical protein
MKMTQREYILDQLLAGRKITRLDIFNEIWCFKLPARICELRQEGYNIKTKMIHLTNANNQKKCFARYWIDQNPQRELF